MILNSTRLLMSLEMWWPRCEDPQAPSDTDFGVELVSGDLSDAYFHFRVHPDERKHCLSPDLWPGTVLLWVDMCCGLRAAPLIWCRFAAGVARRAAGMFDTHEC